MTEEEKARLKELVAKKKAHTLTKEEVKELESLNKKSGFKPHSKGKNPKEDKSGFKPGNDFAWWNKEASLLNDAANFKSNYIPGLPIAGSDIPYIVPGVVLITLESMYGSDRYATDSINVWARDLYLRMFQKYRPVSTYSASDLGITLLAEGEIVKLIAKYERIYGVINRYSRRNVNMPLIEAQALGLTSTDIAYLQAHLSDFRYDLNFLIKKAQRLCVPKDMSILADAISLFGYEYLDHDNPRAQIIMFDINKFGLYDETTVSAGGAIQFNDIDSSNPIFDFNAGNMCHLLDTALNALIGSDSVQRILADLVVWFGSDAMLQFVTMPEDYVVVPAYSESILHKMHNLECLQNFGDQVVSWADPQLTAADQSVITNGQHWVYQVNDRIVTKCGVHVSGGTFASFTVDGGLIVGSNAGYTAFPDSCHVLDTYRVEVTPETVVEGVLFKFTGRRRTDGTNNVTMIDSCCFYIARDIQLYTNTASPTVLSNMTYSNTNQALQKAGNMAILDWAPLSYDLDTSYRISGVYGDMDIIVPLYGNDLSRLHRTILLSGVKTDVPVINK